MKETDIQRAILEYLALRKVFHWRNNSGAYKTATGGFIRYGTLGSPDIMCCVNGNLVGLEVKQPGGRQSDHQKAFEAGLLAAGGRYHVVHSIDEVQGLGL